VSSREKKADYRRGIREREEEEGKRVIVVCDILKSRRFSV
jgi:hypothetical protein